MNTRFLYLFTLLILHNGGIDAFFTNSIPGILTGITKYLANAILINLQKRNKISKSDYEKYSSVISKCLDCACFLLNLA